MNLEIVNPPELAPPKGWNHGLVAPAGARILFIAGQAGWESGDPGEPAGFAAQFARALDKVLAVIQGAGGRPEDLVRLTVYVTDLAEYRASLQALGEGWRARFGKHYPAMALVQVSGLVDRGARVEMEGTAALPGDAR